MKSKPIKRPPRGQRRHPGANRSALLEARDLIAEATGALTAIESILTTSREPICHQLAYLIDPVINTLAQADSALCRANPGDGAQFRKEK